MAIGAAAHKLILDSTKFTEGASLSRKELQFLKQVLRETATDAEKMGAGIDRLADLHKKGALTAEQHERALNKLNEEMGEKPGGAAGGFSGLLGKITPTIDVLNLATRGFDMFRDAVRDASTEIDELSKASRVLGADIGQLQAIRKLADESAGLGAEELDKSFVKLNDSIAEALKNASGEAGKAFKFLNLDPIALGVSSLEGKFNMLSEAFRKADDVAMETDAALALFGRTGAKLRDVLEGDADALENVKQHLEDTRLAINKIEAEKVERMNDSWARVKDHISGAGSALLRDFSGPLADVLDMSNALSSGLARNRPERIAEEFKRLHGIGTRKPLMTPFTKADLEAERKFGELTDLRDMAAMGPGAEGVKEGSGLPGGRIDKMYEEDRAMEAIVDKYKKRRVELELSGPFLEIYRAKLDGLKGAELEAFKHAVDKDEMEKLRVRRLDEELAKKKAIRDVDIDIIRVGSREEAAMFARSVRSGGMPASSAGGGKITTDSPATLARLDKIAKHTAEKIVVHEVTL